MKPNILDKKVNFEYLEKDVGLKRFFPEKILQQKVCDNNSDYLWVAVLEQQFGFKTKSIKKLIIKGIKEYENHNEEDCMLIFLEKLKTLWKYNTETYECHLGVGLKIGND
jgi:focal adhesion kinase 1